MALALIDAFGYGLALVLLSAGAFTKRLFDLESHLAVRAITSNWTRNWCA